MQNLIKYFNTQSADWVLIIIMLVTFLESMAIIGLILPGTVIMVGLGTLIGSGKIIFWQAWISGILGCLLGDWISFWIGWRFKKSLSLWSLMKKNRTLLFKTEQSLHKYSMFTILISRFIGPTRPLVPMIAGMLDLPLIKFFIPSIIGCFLWSPLYFLPGLLAGATFDIPADKHNNCFKWLLLVTTITWLIFWFCWRLRLKSKKNSVNYINYYLSHKVLLYLSLLVLSIAIITLMMLIYHPLLPVYMQILFKILSK